MLQGRQGGGALTALDRAALLRLLGAGAAGASLPALAQVEQALAAGAEGEAGNFPGHPRWRFVFIGHLTTGPLFVPLQYGLQDACALVGCTYKWTGSATGTVEEMLEALDGAISSKAGGIGVSIVDSKAFDEPVERAIRAGIPVVAFHADAPAGSGNARLGFVGQSPYAAGVEIGRRIAGLVGHGEVVLFISADDDPVAARRLRGTLDALKRSAASVTRVVVPVTRDPYEAAARVEEAMLGRKRLRGAFALDVYGTDAVGRAMNEHELGKRGVRAGGYGVLPAALKQIEQGWLDFSVDEQPYLQGFLSGLQLFLTKISSGLVGPAETDTGVGFITKANLARYLAKTRYEGSSSKPRYPIL